ncbi:MAG: hypothetical protein HY676_02665 [Chloroflexi bacterium]|nr:hypothetical protein [Chloroflexota bacterium]
MNLDMGTFRVNGVSFGSKTQLSNGALVINTQELKGRILEDRNFADVEFDIARPGEPVRIIHVTDVVEPRYKVHGPGCVFPGLLGPPTTVGQGITHRLAGVVVTVVGEPVPGEPIYRREAIIEMSGPAASIVPYGGLTHVTLNLKPNLERFPQEEAVDVLGGTPRAELYTRSTLLAGLKAATYLAQATADLRPDSMEAYELTPCDLSLPRVVFMYQVTRPMFYGAEVPIMWGTAIHPNEILDGAVVKGASSLVASGRNTTYLDQNNQVVLEFYRRHGKEVNFLGIVLYGGVTPSVDDKERVSSVASNMARLLGAQAAILTEHAGSNLSQDAMLCLQKCERAGIKTVLIHHDVGIGPDDPGFVFFVPEADAIALTGSREQPVTLPPVKKVIGGTRLLTKDLDPAGQLPLIMGDIYGANNFLGMSRAMTYLH